MKEGSESIDSIAKKGWRQGSILPISLVERLIAENQVPAGFVSRSDSRSGILAAIRYAWRHALDKRKRRANLDSGSDRWIILSQDCDLTHQSIEAEPYVEIARITTAASNNVAVFWGKNPRRYQFESEAGNERLLFDVNVHERVRIDREYLVDSAPDESRQIAQRYVQDLCLWISQRYVRAAFPDEFNKRVKSKLDKLGRKKAFRDHHKKLTAIFIETEADELLDEDYNVVILGTMRTEAFEDSEKRESANGVLQRFETTIAGCKGVNVLDSRIIPESEFSLDQIRRFKRWDYDDLSVREDMTDDLPPPK